MKRIELKPDANGNLIRLSGEELKDIIDDFKLHWRIEYHYGEDYYRGENVYIASRVLVENNSDAPDWRIKVSYGRKICNTVTGYMFKPGCITYKTDIAGDDEQLKLINEINREAIHNNRQGGYLSANGKCYELHYVDDDNNPRFTMIKAADGIALYDYTFDNNIVIFIRLYNKGDVEYYDVYYDDIVETWREVESSDKLEKVSENPNVYQTVPVVEYYNNDDYISDLSPIIKLIDAYDVLASDSMNEFDRFAWAYLLLVGFQLKERDLKEIKRKRVFEKLPDKSAVDFLTKDIPTEFIQFMANWIKQEIHKQSFIPDIDELKFSGAVSGVAIDKFIYLMEYVAVDKESFYHLGLKKRLKMIDRIVPFKDLNKIEIQFTRNLPNNETEKVDNYVKLDGRGISRETLIKHYLTWVKDPQAELEKAVEEQDLFSTFNIEENMNAGQEPDSQQQYTK